ncbi:MAG: hypothetical protein ACK4TA_04490 [Saprospiraceae bacterium]
MKHYLSCSLILAIFLPFLAIAQESAYPDKGFQLEVGTGLWQSVDAYSYNASSIPLFAELKYKFKKIDFSLGYSRGVFALGEDFPIIYSTPVTPGNFFPYNEYEFVSVESILSKTNLYYISLNYIFNKDKPSLILGAGIGKYVTDELLVKDFKYPDVTTNQNTYSSIAKKGNLLAFLQVGYRIGNFRNYLAFNFLQNKDPFYSIPDIHVNTDPFFNFKTAYNINLKKNSKSNNEIFENITPEKNVAHRRYKRISFDFGFSSAIPIDKTAKATALGIYLEPRLNINDDFIIGLRLIDYESADGVDPNSYRFSKWEYRGDSLVQLSYSEQMGYFNSWSVMCDRKIVEKDKFRLFLGAGISVIEGFYFFEDIGFTTRLTSNFGHLRSGFSLNYASKEIPSHAALQFGFEIGGGLRKKSKLVYE